ncbi:MAG: response regulator [Cyanobacteria bacterium P01_A01_bin.116]
MSTTDDWGDISLIALFRLEVETQVNELNEHLLHLEQAGTAEVNSLDVLMRAAHSIKGAARIVQVETAVKVSHALEECFLLAQCGKLELTSDHVDVLLQGVDLLSRLGQLEEAALLDSLPTYDAEADKIVSAIDALAASLPLAARSVVEESSVIEESPVVEESSVVKEDSVATDRPAVVTQVDTAANAAAKPTLEPAMAVPSPKTVETPTVLETLPAAKAAAERGAVASDSERTERMIRIRADNLNRLMGLAGESLVEANWLQPFAQSLLAVKRQQQAVMSQLEKQQEALIAQGADCLKIAETLQTMQTCQQSLGDQLSDLDVFSRRFSQLSDRLYREVISSHMCPFEEGGRGYGRLVRDLAKQLGKQAVLKIEGSTTQVDRDILTKLDVPITHILTNALAHGIETPEARIAKGKPAVGTIRIEAVHRSGMLVIAIEDDGAGIDLDALRQQVVSKGLTTAEVADRLSDAELLEFLFLPGFSTAAQVDVVAGRGYGLDLARNMAISVGGALQVTASYQAAEHPTSGQLNIDDETDDEKTECQKTECQKTGTRFQFRLPLTLSVVRSLLFETAGEPYAIALSRMSQVLMLRPEQIHISEGRPFFTLKNELTDSANSFKNSATTGDGSIENISLLPAGQLLSRSSARAETDEVPVVVIGEAGNRYGLWVDRLMEEKDLVVRPLDTRLGKIPNISAAALSEEGDPILILDVADVLRSAEKIVAECGSAELLARSPDLTASEGGETPSSASPETGGAKKRVLVVEDSMTVRALEKKLLSNQGYDVDIAVDGAEGWNAVRMATYDLVITDVDMPRMSGIELIDRLRAYGPTKAVPVIIVSYKDREEDRLAGLNAGANYYLMKSSFHDNGLINAVVDLIGESRCTT